MERIPTKSSLPGSQNFREGRKNVDMRVRKEKDRPRARRGPPVRTDHLGSLVSVTICKDLQERGLNGASLLGMSQ